LTFGAPPSGPDSTGKMVQINFASVNLTGVFIPGCCITDTEGLPRRADYCVSDPPTLTAHFFNDDWSSFQFYAQVSPWVSFAVFGLVALTLRKVGSIDAGDERKITSLKSLVSLLTLFAVLPIIFELGWELGKLQVRFRFYSVCTALAQPRDKAQLVLDNLLFVVFNIALTCVGPALWLLSLTAYIFALAIASVVYLLARCDCGKNLIAGMRDTKCGDANCRSCQRQHQPERAWEDFLAQPWVRSLSQSAISPFANIRHLTDTQQFKKLTAHRRNHTEHSQTRLALSAALELVEADSKSGTSDAKIQSSQQSRSS